MMITCIMGCYFLIGSTILPLGDFSLMKDLPQMYRSYEKLATSEERGIIDFIGDYLMGGKVVLGHNKNDVHETSNSKVQFQHAPVFCSIASIQFQLISTTVADAVIIYPHISIPFHITEFHQELFRPPLATFS